MTQQLYSRNHEAQQFRLHGEASAQLQNNGAHGLIARAYAGIEEGLAALLGYRQRAHGRSARHVEILGFLENLYKWCHLGQSSALIRSAFTTELAISLRNALPCLFSLNSNCVAHRNTFGDR